MTFISLIQTHSNQLRKTLWENKMNQETGKLAAYRITKIQDHSLIIIWNCLRMFWMIYTKVKKTEILEVMQQKCLTLRETSIILV